MATRFDLITNALGSVEVRNQQANIILDPVEYAFLGNATVRIKVRQDSITGPVLLESPPITIIDNAEFLSVTANTYSVAEGSEVKFSVLTRNAPDGAAIAYVAEATSANITANDLAIGNISGLGGGLAPILDNIATFTIYANVDSILNEVGETFRVAIKAGNTFGTVLGYSDNVTIKDTSELYNITADKSTVDFNTNVTFTIQTFDVADGANLFYFTQGDITNFDTGNAQANTGYIITSSNTATVVLRPIAPINTIKPFNLLLRDAATNTLLSSSPAVNAVGEETIFNSITGGTETVIGNYKYHVFTSSNTFIINKIGETYPEVQIFAVGAGQPGSAGNYFSWGGGGGQVVDTTYNMPQAIKFNQGSVTVAQTSPTGVSPATSVSFGSGGTTITANSGNKSTSGSGFAQTQSNGSGGGGSGSVGQVSYSPNPTSLQGGSGGYATRVPWLAPTGPGGGLGETLLGPLGYGGQFGGGGGGGVSMPTNSNILGYGGGGGYRAGQGNYAIYESKSHYYAVDQTFTRVTVWRLGSGFPAINYGSGGGGGCLGYSTITYGQNYPASMYRTTYTSIPGGSGVPGAVIMRYRIAED